MQRDTRQRTASGERRHILLQRYGLHFHAVNLRDRGPDWSGPVSSPLIMTSERVQRRIERLLDQAEEALETRAWDPAAEFCRAALALDPDNADALAFLEAATQATSGDAASGSSSPGETSAPAAREPISGRSKDERASSVSEYRSFESLRTRRRLRTRGPGDRERAGELQDEALAIARELGMRPLTERILARRNILRA